MDKRKPRTAEKQTGFLLGMALILLLPPENLWNGMVPLYFSQCPSLSFVGMFLLLYAADCVLQGWRLAVMEAVLALGGFAAGVFSCFAYALNAPDGFIPNIMVVLWWAAQAAAMLLPIMWFREARAHAPRGWIALLIIILLCNIAVAFYVILWMVYTPVGMLYDILPKWIYHNYRFICHLVDIAPHIKCIAGWCAVPALLLTQLRAAGQSR